MSVSWGMGKVELTKEQKNIISYRLITIGELRLLDVVAYQLSDVKGNKILGGLESGKYKGLLLTLNERLEGIRVLSVSNEDLDDTLTIVRLTVNVEEDPENNYELEFMVGETTEINNEESIKLHVVEED